MFRHLGYHTEDEKEDEKRSVCVFVWFPLWANPSIVVFVPFFSVFESMRIRLQLASHCPTKTLRSCLFLTAEPTHKTTFDLAFVCSVPFSSHSAISGALAPSEVIINVITEALSHCLPSFPPTQSEAFWQLRENFDVWLGRNYGSRKTVTFGSRLSSVYHTVLCSLNTNQFKMGLLFITLTLPVVNCHQLNAKASGCDQMHCLILSFFNRESFVHALKKEIHPQEADKTREEMRLRLKSEVPIPWPYSSCFKQIIPSLM